MSTRLSGGVDDCPCFSAFLTMIPIECKITNFPFTCLFTFFGNNYSIVEFISANSKERMTTNIIFAGATPIN